jgi:hypothetical protein
MRVTYQNAMGKFASVDCTDLEEGENGVYLLGGAGSDRIGYLPYDRFLYAVPADAA